VHHADNRFAGAAPIPELIKAANLSEFLTGNPWMTRINDIVCRDASGATHACNGDDSLNERGLSAEGAMLVQAMMDRGLLLDVAHLSRRAFRDVHALSAPRGYPLLYSHTHAWDIVDPHEKRHEKYLRADEIALLTDNGGMVGLRTGPEDTVAYGNTVANWCQGSARSFAQSLMYLVDQGLSVGFGADLNGFTRQLRPRYRDTCWFDKVQLDGSGGPNWLQSKGLAHVGLLPMLRSDLQAIGVPPAYLAHLDRSAETFLQLWERSASLAVTGGSNLALGATTTASSTYCQGTGEHCYSAARINDGNNTTALGGYHSWANAGYTPMPQWVELTWPAAVTFTRVELFSTSGYVLRDYDLEYFDGAAWVTLTSQNGNVAVHRTHSFAPVSGTRLRVSGRSGPSHQAGYVRVNEIEVY
jgi:microsomal dipeptidase-like Zn-dependent dipeptidase